MLVALAQRRWGRLTVMNLIGRTLAGRYIVLQLLGTGGMGHVYRVHDRELDEMVALKVIRPELVRDEGARARFRREVKLARRVTHQNVARTFELGSDGEVTFCTMELLEGESLAHRLATSGRLPVAEAVELGLALCEALLAAHSAGVIHRDIKPDNVLLTPSGRVVLSDFGIAAASTTGAEICGTAGYMAPEQALGAVPSPAADVYSLGVVLFEAFGGTQAFPGGLAEKLAVAQCTEQLQLADFEVPEIVKLVAEATALEPGRRPSALELRTALAACARAPRAPADRAPVREPDLPALVIRPGRCEPDAPVHMARGFRDELVRRLEHLPGLRVIARDATPPGATVVDIGAHRDHVQLSIQQQIAIANVALRLDSEQALTSADLAVRLIAAMVGATVAPSPPAPALDSRVLELIWRARQAYRQPRQVAEGAELCERARQLAPQDPRVLATLALLQVRSAFFSTAPPAGLLAVAARHATAARRLDPSLADAHLACGQVELHRGSPVAASIHLRAAIACAPNLAEAHEWLGRLLVEAGHLIDGMHRLRDAVAMDPSLGGTWWDSSRVLALEGSWIEIDRELDRMSANGSLRGARWGARIRFAAWRSPIDYTELARLHREIVEDEHGFERELMLAVCEQLLGLRDARGELLARAADPTVQSLRRRAFIAQLAAEAFGHAGEVAAGMALLEQSLSQGLFDLHWVDRCPLLTPLRAHPRFSLLRAEVARRSEAIHDALFNEYASREEFPSDGVAFSPTLRG